MFNNRPCPTRTHVVIDEVLTPTDRLRFLSILLCNSDTDYRRPYSFPTVCWRICGHNGTDLHSVSHNVLSSPDTAYADARQIMRQKRLLSYSEVQQQLIPWRREWICNYHSCRSCCY